MYNLEDCADGKCDCAEKLSTDVILKYYNESGGLEDFFNLPSTKINIDTDAYHLVRDVGGRVEISYGFPEDGENFV